MVLTRVVHVVWSLDVGGLEQVVVDLTTHRRGDCFAVQVICMAEPGRLAERLRAAGVPVESLGPSTLSAGRRLLRLARRLRALQPDVVHTHNVKPHIHGTLASILARVPVVINTKHGRNHATTTVALTVTRLLSRACDAMVAVSHDAAAIATGIERMPTAKVRVIHNGIDLDRYRPTRAYDPQQFRRIVTVARLNPVKDQVTLLRAMRMVVDQDPACHLTIAGDGPCREALATLARQLDLEKHVTFLGYCADVPAVLADAGQFVLSSLSEGISLTLLEAMAAGLPVVATRVGGSPEIVQDRETGLLVRPARPAELAKALLSIVRDPEASAAMGRAGRVRVERQFSVASTVATYEHLYSELAAVAAAS